MREKQGNWGKQDVQRKKPKTAVQGGSDFEELGHAMKKFSKEAVYHINTLGSYTDNERPLKDFQHMNDTISFEFLKNYLV